MNENVFANTTRLMKLRRSNNQMPHLPAILTTSPPPMEHHLANNSLSFLPANQDQSKKIGGTGPQ